MGKGKLSQRLRSALELAEHLNRDVDMYAYEVPAVVAEGELQAMIYNNTEGVKVVMACAGCCPGRQHYRKATPKTLSQAGALYCKLCMVCGDQPKRAGVTMPCSTEQRFMSVLWLLGVDQCFMHQVVPPFWHRSMDFFNYVVGYYVQVDGSCHWKGMHGRSRGAVLDADFEQARRALEQGATLVRIHEADISRVEVVAAALAAAQGFVGIVLSPSYAEQQVPCQGQSMPYTQTLVGLNPNLAQSPGPAGIILLSKQ